jgi:hypothetical protein
MSIFNPFDFFILAPDAEQDNAGSHPRDCANTYDTAEFEWETGDWEARVNPHPENGLSAWCSFRQAVEQLRRRIGRR